LHNGNYKKQTTIVCRLGKGLSGRHWKALGTAQVIVCSLES